MRNRIVGMHTEILAYVASVFWGQVFGKWYRVIYIVAWDKSSSTVLGPVQKSGHFRMILKCSPLGQGKGPKLQARVGPPHNVQGYKKNNS